MGVRQMTAWFWQKRWRLLAVALIAVALAYGLVQAALGPKVPVYRVAQSELVQTVVASGRVETPLRVEIGSQITGVVARIPVVEGQSVKASQTLIVLEDSEASAAFEQARAAVAQAEARLKQLREVALPAAEQALRQAEVNLQNLRRQHARTRELQASGFLGQSQLDDAQRNLDVAESQVRAAQLQVATNRPQGSDYLLAKAALDQAQAGLRTAQAKLAYTTIKAPVDGTLIARNVERGDVVQAGKALMVLSPDGETQLVVQIDEKNLANLKFGQQALASADAYPGQRFSAELVYINPAIDPQRGSVEVKLRVPAPPAYLRQDMTVSVDIEVARRAHALALSANAVHDIAGPTPWVMQVNDGRAKRQPVTLGIRGAGQIEILDGLRKGDLALPVTGVNVSEGQRIRAVPR